MSKAKLKKVFSQMSREELINLLTELYDSRKEVKEYLEYWLDPDIEKATEKVRGEINKVYFLPSGKARSKGRISEVKKLIKDFSNMVFDTERSMELSVYALEKRSDWIGTRSKPLKYESDMRKLIEDLDKTLEQNDMTVRFGLRVEKLKEKVDRIFDIAKEKELTPRRYRKYFKWS